MNAGLVILILKIAVATVTVLWISSLIALARGNIKLHGRINIVFFILTLTALIGLEVIVQIISPKSFDDFLNEKEAKGLLFVHLCFSMPTAVLLFVMLFTGLTRSRRFHIATGILFSVLWVGTFITGIFFLPPYRVLLDRDQDGWHVGYDLKND
jgi:uncharacterized membrane protein YozB (DUF420 family)